MPRLTVLTLNCWFPPYASQRTERAHAIAAELLRLQPDIICLQEMFLPAPRAILMNALRPDYPHQRYFEAGLIGSGLVTVSRLPIVQHAFERFALAGKAEDIQHGDYFAGKGVGVVRVLLEGEPLDIYNTHTHAQYEPQHDNEYALYTISNLWQTALFVRRWSQGGRCLVAGDLNTRPDQAGYRIIREVASLTDSYAALHPHDPGITYSRANPYVVTHDQRLDYILLGPGLAPISARIALAQHPIDDAPAFSDHYAVQVTLETTEAAPPAAVASLDLRQHTQTLALRELKLTDNQELAEIQGIITLLLVMLDARRLLRLLPHGLQPVARPVYWLLRVLLIARASLHVLQLMTVLPARRRAITRTIDFTTAP